MTKDKVELGWADLRKMVDEVKSDNGPGSQNWDPDGSETRRVNELFMRALRENKGKVPGELEAMPSLIITTTGAKTGEKRAVPLNYQIVDGRLFVIASMAGANRNPPWFFNLVKTPEVLVEKDGESFSAKAVVTEGEDRVYLYQKIVEVVPVLKEYQTKVTRKIPIVELKRIGR